MERQPYKFLILESPQMFYPKRIPRSSSEEFFSTEPYEDDPRGSIGLTGLEAEDDDLIKVTPTSDVSEISTKDTKFDKIEVKIEEATYQTTRGPVTFQWVTYPSNVSYIAREDMLGLFGVVFMSDEIETKWKIKFPSYL